MSIFRLTQFTGKNLFSEYFTLLFLLPVTLKGKAVNNLKIGSNSTVLY